MSTQKPNNVTGLLGYTLKATQHALRLHMDDVLKSLDLTTPQYAVLAQLELRPGISNAELARAAFITAQTMHSIVTNLEKRNLVHRKPDPAHGRILRTELTKNGCEIVQQAHKVIQKVEAIMTASLTDNHKALLEALLVDCFKNLNARKMGSDGKVL